MHDQDYHKAKAMIMKPIDEFFVLLDARTASAVQAAQSANAFWHAIAIASIAAALITLLAALYLVYRQTFGQLGNEPQVVVHAVSRIAAGDLQSDILVSRHVNYET